MKVKTLASLAGLGGTLIASGANAAFVNLTIENVNTMYSASSNPNVSAAWTSLNNATPGGINTYRVYANFTSATDRVEAIFGDSLAGMTATFNAHGSVYNFEGTPTSPVVFDAPTHNNAALNSDPQRAFDTWATIGQSVVTPPTGGGFAGNTTGFAPETVEDGPDADALSATDHFRNSVWVMTDNAWFVTGFPPQANALAGGPSGFRVLVFQVTVLGESVAGAPITPSGQWGVQWSNSAAGPTGIKAFGENTRFGDIPAPGALALLGLAGVVGGRRRRA